MIDGVISLHLYVVYCVNCQKLGSFVSFNSHFLPATTALEEVLYLLSSLFPRFRQKYQKWWPRLMNFYVFPLWSSYTHRARILFQFADFHILIYILRTLRHCNENRIRLQRRWCPLSAEYFTFISLFTIFYVRDGKKPSKMPVQCRIGFQTCGYTASTICPLRKYYLPLCEVAI